MRKFRHQHNCCRLKNRRAYAVQQTQDGGYVVCGESNFDFWILKLNSDGTVAWQKSYDEGGWNRARSIEQTADGGYIVAGEGDSSLWVLKLNADGTVAWQKTYGGGGMTQLLPSCRLLTVAMSWQALRLLLVKVITTFGS